MLSVQGCSALFQKSLVFATIATLKSQIIWWHAEADDGRSTPDSQREAALRAGTRLAEVAVSN